MGGTGVTSAAGGGGGEFEGEVRITADPSTNALIIYASPQDFETLKRVIEMLDVRRRQAEPGGNRRPGLAHRNQ